MYLLDILTHMQFSKLVMANLCNSCVSQELTCAVLGPQKGKVGDDETFKGRVLVGVS
jgi:hypothetical protein